MSVCESAEALVKCVWLTPVVEKMIGINDRDSL